MAKKRNVELNPTKRPDYIAFGSTAHKAMLGLVEGVIMTPEQRQGMEEALETKPKPYEGPLAKEPVTRENYERGDVVRDGWVRMSR